MKLLNKELWENPIKQARAKVSSQVTRLVEWQIEW